MVSPPNPCKLSKSFASPVSDPIDLVIGVRTSSKLATLAYIGCHRAMIFPELPVIAEAMRVDMMEKRDGVFVVSAEYADLGIVRFIRVLWLILTDFCR